MTKIFDFKDKINEEELKEASFVIKENGLVIFPTETVYGLGANALNEEAVSKIFIAKGRPNDNPLIVHISNFDMLNELTKNITDIEKKLIDAFFPGPFTLILEKSDLVPNNVTCNLNTVGIRMPSNKIANRLIELSGPIAAPSANISGRPSGTKASDIIEEFNDKVDIIIDGGSTKIGLESTVVKVINGVPTILRPGYVTLEDIKKVIGKAIVHDKIINNEKVLSPGLKYKHYAPESKCLLVFSDKEDKQIEYINQIIKPDMIVIGYKEHKNKIKTDNYFVHGSINNYEEISHSIFSLLREADKLKPSLIIIEGVHNMGLGMAINNRLIRSCSHNYINV